MDGVQLRSHVPDRDLEQKLLQMLRSGRAPALIVFGGSAGTGKTALMARLRQAAPELFGEIIADATHTESPGEEQVSRLASFFSPFADGAAPASGPTRMIALNTGMALRFFHKVRQDEEAPGLTALEGILLPRLGVPRAAPAADAMEWRGDAVLVLNLDLRRTAGGPEALFLGMLKALDPDDPSGVLAGAARCGSCRVREWCWPRTNAELVSADETGTVLDGAVALAALERGRNISPRELWALAAALVLGGARGVDPCEDVAGAFAAGDSSRLRDGLLPGAALEDLARDEPLAASLLAMDPTLQPNAEAHEEIASAGIDPADDAERLLALLGGADPTKRQAVRTVAAHAAEGPGLTGRYRARARWLAAQLTPGPSPDEGFRAALSAFDGPPDPAADVRIMETLAVGLARGFGRQVGADTFLPVDKPGQSRTYGVLVGANLSAQELLEITADPHQESNQVGAGLLRYRPLALPVRLGRHRLEITLPIWRLLQAAAAGTLPGTDDLERFHGLRRAVESAVLELSLNPANPLLISDTNAGRHWRAANVRTRGGDQLNVYEVS
ncbi:hypothetical protein [Streptomyces sp. NPDC004589]|uniref:hypothetical protein n=1 Tax=Streptomyces sp. NPDC004589 TaxID=3154553 RepID=UPI0033B3CA79